MRLIVAVRSFTRTGGQAYFFVEAPPDFRDPGELRKFMGFVKAIERTPRALGPNSTLLWLRPYMDSLAYTAADPLAEFYAHIGDWLAGRSQWTSFLRLNASSPPPGRLHAFYFTTGFHVCTLVTPARQDIYIRLALTGHRVLGQEGGAGAGVPGRRQGLSPVEGQPFPGEPLFLPLPILLVGVDWVGRMGRRTGSTSTSSCR